MATGNVVEPPSRPRLSPQQQELIWQGLRLEAQVRSGARNFYWIAILSLVNSALYAYRLDLTFPIGLGITQVVDVISQDIANASGGGAVIVRVIGLVIDLLILGLIALIGRSASGKKSWAFIVGIVLYTLDGLIYLLVGDFIGLALHALFLFFIIRGYLALRQLHVFEAAYGVISMPQSAPRTTRTREYWIRILIIPAIALIIMLVVAGLILILYSVY